MRCFVALPIPDKYRQECQALVASLEKHSLPVKWVASHNFHVTLKFIGETREEMLPKIIAKVALSVQGVPPISLSLETVGVFPLQGTPRVIWVGIRQKEDRLGALAKQLNHQLAALGFPADARGFSPHLTLGRVRSGSTIERVLLKREFSTKTFQGSEVVLYESRLTPLGPVYTPLKIFPLT